MFWFGAIRDLRERVANLERINEIKQIKDNCAAGDHVWEMSQFDKKNPYARCIHCGRQPESAYK